MSWSAHLPIYDLPELRGRNDALWSVIAEAFRTAGIDAVPARLDGEGERELFTQVCGFPLQTAYRGRYALLGTPVYAVDGCYGTGHRAFVVVHEASPYREPADLRGTTFAVNDRLSNTGMNLPRRLLARIAKGRPFFNRVTISGSHAESAAQVAGGTVAAASIDCVTFAFLEEFRPELTARLRVIARTDWSPAIPFVTADDGDIVRIANLRRALLRLSNDPSFTPLLAALHIDRITRLNDSAYALLRTYEEDAIAARYPVLC